MPAILRRSVLILAGAALLVAACGHREPDPTVADARASSGQVFPVHDTTIVDELEATGIAEPVQSATLSTKLMGRVTDVLVHEGETVRAGQVLARIDARDLAARRAQVAAAMAEAEAVQRDAVTQAERFRGLFADSAATQAQLDAAETGLARANAGVRTAQASAREVEATASYATISAPFAGVVSRRFVDPGAFVAPGAPIVTVLDASRLRITVTIASSGGIPVSRGAAISGTIAGRDVRGVVEGAVPSGTEALTVVNALVPNRDGALPAGGAATLRIPQGRRTAILIPQGAVVREGDLAGVRVAGTSGPGLRWVRLGQSRGDLVEVLSGLTSGDSIRSLPAVAE